MNKIKNTAKHITSFLLLLILICSIGKLNAQFYNGTHTGFGKNRVQYDYFEWKYYRFQQYETYFYTGGQELAVYTAKVARKYIKEQEDMFEYHLKDKIQFIIYNKHSHFKQSNVGLSLEDGELGGITNLMGSKVYIYFNGDHADLDKQIKSGIAQVLINQQVYGSNWTQVLRNSSLLSLPEWYSKGLTSYISENWSPEIENSVRDGIISGKYKKFNRLTDKEAVIAGHSIWSYIINTYGEAVVPNILYMTRVTQSIDKGFLYVLGVSTKSLTQEWLQYYTTEYKHLPPTNKNHYKEDELFKVKKRRDYQQFIVSPDGNNFAFVTNQLGQYKIYIYYKDSDKKYKIYKKEYKLDRINDKSFPVLAWHPASEVLAFVTEEKGVLLMHYFDINTGGIQVKALFQLEKLLSMDYSDNGKEMVFSGVYKGQSDIYHYYIAANSHKKVTNDKWDDLSPRFIENATKIVFTSNRTTDSLSYEPNDIELFRNKKDVWIIDYLAKEKTLARVTETPEKSEYQPFGVDSMLYYLGDDNGSLSRYSAVKDSFITHIDTAIHYYHFYEAKPALKFYNRSVSEHNIQKNGGITEVLRDNYRYHLLDGNLTDKKKISLNSTNIIDEVTEAETQNSNIKTILLKPVKLPNDTITSKVDIHHYTFNNEGEKVQRHTIVIHNVETEKDTLLEIFKLPNQRNYNLSFFNDNSAIKLSNSFVNEQYQMFTSGPYISPGIGAVFKLSTIDLFEDRKIYGGIRFSGTTKEYFMTYQNFEKRWDKEYTYSRTTYDITNGIDIMGVSANTIHYSLKYPFSEVWSWRGTMSGRNDNFVIKSINDASLQAPNTHEYRAVGKTALVFDNTRNKMVNIYYGTKFKIFGEYYQEVFDDAKNSERGNMQVVGFDLRHSQKISREIVWVNRLAASSSFGSEKLIYYLGSVDDWMRTGGTQFINPEDIDRSVNYKYQALAANMRGFPQNIRRGTNFAVFNSELRVPVFKYLIRRPIRSKFIRNFQAIGFTDVGTAWNGLNPWDKDNLINKDIVTDGPITVTVFKNIDPIVAGYGFGVRSTILGYFVRADWAWGVENGISKNKPIFYLSLSLDI